MLRDLVVKLYYRVGRKGICRVSQPPEPRLPTTVIPDDQKPRSLAVGRPRGFERSQAISDNRGDPSLRRQPVVFEVAGEPESSRCIPPEATWMVTMEPEELGEAAD
jgi:hypothetical protein